MVMVQADRTRLRLHDVHEVHPRVPAQCGVPAATLRVHPPLHPQPGVPGTPRSRNEVRCRV